MKIIFSRKGFDSSAGGVASPILPDCTLCSLPIPIKKEARCFNEIRFGEQSLGTLVQELTNGNIRGDEKVHFDPDLRFSSLPRAPGWKPLFGQSDQAERHLRNQDVKKGDIFLFFGWFRRVVPVAGSYQYAADAPDLHVIFGWLQIEQWIPTRDRAQIPVWAYDHPHVIGQPPSGPDMLYIATEHLALPGLQIELPGGGVFEHFDPALCLTATGPKRSVWRLPGWFHPGAGRTPLTYHGNLRRWTPDGDYVLLQTVGRGQEFVLDCEAYPEAIGWLADLFNKTYT
jgi:hypothetical protein